MANPLQKKAKQECIPVGCVLPTLPPYWGMVGVSLTETPLWTETPPGQTAYGQRPHGQRRPPDRDPPGQRQTGVKTLPSRNFVSGW